MNASKLDVSDILRKNIPHVEQMEASLASRTAEVEDLLEEVKALNRLIRDDTAEKDCEIEVMKEKLQALRQRGSDAQNENSA